MKKIIFFVLSLLPLMSFALVFDCPAPSDIHVVKISTGFYLEARIKVGSETVILSNSASRSKHLGHFVGAYLQGQALNCCYQASSDTIHASSQPVCLTNYGDVLGSAFFIHENHSRKSCFFDTPQYCRIQFVGV